MEIEGKVRDIKVSTVYRSGTSLGYGIKIGKMVLATNNGNVYCEFEGYTYYIGLRRGDRVIVEGEFSEQKVERGERVFQVLKISSLETGETWKFTPRNLNLKRFVAIWCISFTIIYMIALIILDAMVINNPGSLFGQTLFIFKLGYYPESARIFIALVPILFTNQANSALIAYLGAVPFVAFLALFPSVINEIIEGRLSKKESYEKGEVERLLRENVCTSCGAKVPEGLDACLECGEIVVKCTLCKSIMSPEEACYCPYCNSSFHRDHLLEWIKIKGSCPHCARRISREKVRWQT